jgi:5'(3')-deoxyribonucleotidase
LIVCCQTGGFPPFLPYRNRIFGHNRALVVAARLQNNFPAVMGAFRATFVAFRAA